MYSDDLFHPRPPLTVSQAASWVQYLIDYFAHRVKAITPFELDCYALKDIVARMEILLQSVKKLHRQLCSICFVLEEEEVQIVIAIIVAMHYQLLLFGRSKHHTYAIADGPTIGEMSDYLERVIATHKQISSWEGQKPDAAPCNSRDYLSPPLAGPSHADAANSLSNPDLALSDEHYDQLGDFLRLMRPDLFLEGLSLSGINRRLLEENFGSLPPAIPTPLICPLCGADETRTEPVMTSSPTAVHTGSPGTSHVFPAKVRKSSIGELSNASSSTCVDESGSVDQTPPYTSQTATSMRSRPSSVSRPAKRRRTPSEPTASPPPRKRQKGLPGLPIHIRKNKPNGAIEHNEGSSLDPSVTPFFSSSLTHFIETTFLSGSPPPSPPPPPPPSSSSSSSSSLHPTMLLDTGSFLLDEIDNWTSAAAWSPGSGIITPASDGESDASGFVTADDGRSVCTLEEEDSNRDDEKEKWVPSGVSDGVDDTGTRYAQTRPPSNKTAGKRKCFTGLLRSIRGLF